jgi:hypothetical protein
MLIRTTDSIWKSSSETAQRRDLHSFVGAVGHPAVCLIGAKTQPFLRLYGRIYWQ